MKPACPYCLGEIDPTDQYSCPACQTPHHQSCWNANHGCTIYGCTEAPKDDPPIKIEGPVFRYIPVARFVALSILTVGIYEAYWIYRNWLYLKDRDILRIKPGWRGFFGIFFIKSLLTAIKNDKIANSHAPANFSPGGLAAGWIICVLLSNFTSRVGIPAIAILGSVVSILSFLFLLPVQEYINRVNEALPLPPGYFQWSRGEKVLLVIGIVLWPFMLLVFLVPTQP